MSDKSAIEWTDATWNPVRGCTKVSPGCANCYAETFAERFRGVKDHPYEQGFDLRLVPEKLGEPLRRKKPTTYFVNSMSDLFQDGVPDAFSDQVFAVMALAARHTFQVLTKRPDRMLDYMTRPAKAVARRFLVADAMVASGTKHAETAAWNVSHGLTLGAEPAEPRWPLPNVWLGVSVENQHFADERIPLLLQTPAAVRFISAEPLLEAVKLDPFLPWKFDTFPQHIDSQGRGYNSNRESPNRLDWVIVGGESGPGARPFDVAWARSIVAQCKAAGVPVFVKQLGANIKCSDRHFPFPPPARYVHSEEPLYGVRLRDRKGGDMAEWPEDLRVREFPTRTGVQ